jgi:hypothetical protein
MTDLRIRNVDHLQDVDRLRELFRHQLPQPGQSDGMVVTDIDIMFRLYGTQHGTDEMGRYCLTEFKYGKGSLPAGQRCTFYVLHDDLRRSMSDRYAGFWVITWAYADQSKVDRNDRFDYDNVTLVSAVRQFDQPTLRIDGHAHILEFLRTLDDSLAVEVVDDEDW